MTTCGDNTMRTRITDADDDSEEGEPEKEPRPIPRGDDKPMRTRNTDADDDSDNAEPEHECPTLSCDKPPRTRIRSFANADHGKEQEELEEERAPFSCEDSDLLPLKEKLEALYGIEIDQEEQDEYLKSIPKVRAQIKLDVLKNKLVVHQAALAQEHNQNVRDGKETYDMNEYLRETYLYRDGRPFMEVDDEDLIQQFTRSSYTVPFLVDIASVFDAYAASQKQSETVPEDEAVRQPHASSRRKSRHKVRRRHSRFANAGAKAAHRQRPENSCTAEDNQSQTYENPTPTRFSTPPLNSADEHEFVPKISSSSTTLQPSTRVNALAPLLTATKTKTVCGRVHNLYTQTPRMPTSLSLTERTAAALKRFGTTITPTLNSSSTSNLFIKQSGQDKLTTNSKPKPKAVEKTRKDDVIHITPADAATMTGLRPSKSYSNFNGTASRDSTHKVFNNMGNNAKISSNSNPKLVKYSPARYGPFRKGSTTKFVSRYNNFREIQPAVPTEDTTQVDKALPISFLPQPETQSGVSGIRPAISCPQLRLLDSSAGTTPVIVNVTSLRDQLGKIPNENGPVITNVMSMSQVSQVQGQPQNPVIILNPSSGATLTPISISAATSASVSTPATPAGGGATINSPLAKRRYEEVLHGHKPILPKPPALGGTVGTTTVNINMLRTSASTGRLLNPTPAVDPLAWTPSSLAAATNTPLASLANGPVPVPVMITTSPSMTLNTVSQLRSVVSEPFFPQSSSAGQNLLLNSNNIVFIPTTLSSTYSTNSILTPLVSETLYNAAAAGAGAASPCNDNEAVADADGEDENEILGL